MTDVTPPPIASTRDAERAAIGTWTYSGRRLQYRRGDYTWVKLVFHSDGTVDHYAAHPVDSGWGQPEKMHYEGYTDKYHDTGKRYYGVKILSDLDQHQVVYTYTIFVGDQLHYVNWDLGWDAPLDRGDANPFSK